MDSDANLTRQREISRSLLEDDLPHETVTNLAMELAELVQALDQWLVRDGFLPGAWAR